MALKGELGEFTVEQVLRLLQLSRQTGTLDVRGPAGKTSVEVSGGAVSNVRGTDDPEMALGRALLAREGTFTFKPGPTAERVIDAPLDELIERSRAKAAEAIEIEAAIPDENARFRLSERAMSGTAFTVAPDELKVLMEVGGGRSVKEIRQRSRARTRTIAVLYRLLRRGLVERTESTAAVAVEVKAPPRRPPRRAAHATEIPAARIAAATTPPAAMPEPEIDLTPAPVETPPADLDVNELGAEIDLRLALIAGATAPEMPTPPASEVAGEIIVVTPSVAPAPAGPGGLTPQEGTTVVFALHYMPPTAQPVEVAAPPPAPRRRGLFDLLLRRPATVAARPVEIDVPSPAELAAFANALYEEYQRQAYAPEQLGSWADRASRAFEEPMSQRLARAYSARPIGARLPLRGEVIDVDALRTQGIPPARTLPYLALLVRDLRDEAIRVFGADEARSTYGKIAQRTFGRAVATPTLMLRHAERPFRGRLTIQMGGHGTFELRDRGYVIGRAPACDIVLTDPSVSARHAQLVPDVLGVRLSDLGSTNGTKVDGSKITGDRLLRGGEQISLGEALLRYEQIEQGA